MYRLYCCACVVGEGDNPHQEFFLFEVLGLVGEGGNPEQVI